MVTQAEMDAFYEGKRTTSLPLAVNDYVTVTFGKRAGARAAVISLNKAEPNPAYLVEYGDGSDEVVLLANIKTN
jgi:hypothetical protein